MPKHYYYIPITEIFTDEQKKELKKFLKEHKHERPLELTGELKKLFGKWKEDLIRKGILPDFLAYAFAFKLSQVGYDRMIDELSKVI